jgi:hypothetical protein
MKTSRVRRWSIVLLMALLVPGLRASESPFPDQRGERLDLSARDDIWDTPSTPDAPGARRAPALQFLRQSVKSPGPGRRLRAVHARPRRAQAGRPALSPEGGRNRARCGWS